MHSREDVALASGASMAFDRQRYHRVRDRTEALVAALSPEDQGLQSMPDASPAKWHRAHTTWFFEEFILRPFLPDYRPFDAAFRYLFNSYYEAVGDRHPRPMRGLLSRPSADAITAYRAHVDAAITRLPDRWSAEIQDRLELGLQHEEQHQELLVVDTLHAFAQHPDCPAVLPGWQQPHGTPGPASRVPIDGGLETIGHAGKGFAFDNEHPRHKVYLQPFRLCSHLVRNSEIAAFIADGGYRTAALWMSDGWQAVQQAGWSAPLHWRRIDGGWQQATPGGLHPVDPDAPVRHLSWYEADAFARWAGARLPTEAEWEASLPATQIHERTGHVWQWTSSAYSPYPGFKAAAGAIGEYNGKFMINQMVLRGGSAVTPEGHTRPTYRNFFHPDRRWQFSGLRLAWDA
jgi:ergothioneine biosynthesis protein EgtB